MGIGLRHFLDTGVFLYAVGTEHQYREPCRLIVEAAGRREFDAVVNIEVLQEYVHVRTRKGVSRSVAARESIDIVSICRVADVVMAGFQVGLRLFADYPSIEFRDAIHIATAQAEMVDGIVSADRGFDSVTGLLRLDPVDLAARLG